MEDEVERSRSAFDARTGEAKAPKRKKVNGPKVDHKGSGRAVGDIFCVRACSGWYYVRKKTSCCISGRVCKASMEHTLEDYPCRVR